MKIGDRVKLIVDDHQFAGKEGILIEHQISRSSRCVVMIDYIKVSVPIHCIELVSASKG